MSVASETPTRLLRLPQVKQRTTLSRSSIYAKAAAGEFPAPVKLGDRAVAWLDDEVEAWIADRVKASRGVAERVAR